MKKEIFKKEESLKEEAKDKEAINTIREQLRAKKDIPFLAHRLNRLSVGWSESLSPESSDEELRPMLDFLKRKYREAIELAYDEDTDSRSVFGYLEASLEIAELFKIGTKNEVLNAFLALGKHDEKTPGSRYYRDAGKFMEKFLEQNYFPDDPVLNLFARDLIMALLEKSYKKENIKKALEHIDFFIKKGILNEGKDADLIEKATS